MQRKINAILKIIAEAKEPVGSKEIAARLAQLGLPMSERTVRYHLKQLNDQGLLKIFWKEGRLLTQKGKEELENSMVSEKIGLVSAQLEALSYLMDFDLDKMSGLVVVNLSLFHKSDFQQALKIMREVFAKNLGMGNKVLVAGSGEEIGQITVPKGKLAFGTLCAINLNGILLKKSIPIESKFGGVLQIEAAKPLRFTELVSYSGSTIDPHEIFIRSKMTSVREAAKGSGKVLAGLREIPSVARAEAENIIEQIEAAGLGNVLYIGKPGQSVLGVPVGMERVGLVVPGGLNPVAACEEWGLETDSRALSALVDLKRLENFKDLG